MFASRHTCPPLLPHSLFHPVSTQFRVQYIFLLVLPRIPTTKVLVSAQRSVWRENVRRTEGKNASEISEEWFFNRGPRGTVEEKEEEDPPAPVRGSQEIRQRGSGGRSVAFTLVAPWWFTARPVWFSQRGIWRRINGIMISCVTLRMRARPINQAALWGAGREGGLLSPLAPSSLHPSLSLSFFLSVRPSPRPSRASGLSRTKAEGTHSTDLPNGDKRKPKSSFPPPRDFLSVRSRLLRLSPSPQLRVHGRKFFRKFVPARVTIIDEDRRKEI